MTKILPCRLKESFLDTLTCWVSISVLIGGFLDILVSPLFAVYTFIKKEPLRLMFFFSKYSKFYVDSRNGAKNSENIFFWNNSIRIGCVRHLLLLRENTCHRVSVCEQTVSRFQILLKQNFSSWFRFRVIKKYEKNSGLQISVVFPTV